MVINTTDADIYNVILAKYEAGEASYFSTATNNSGSSATSTVNIGVRTSEVLNTSLANTQAKLDLWANSKLMDMTRRTMTAQASVGALDILGDIITIKVGQLLQITDPVTGLSDIYIVLKCDLSETENSIDWQIEVSLL